MKYKKNFFRTKDFLLLTVILLLIIRLVLMAFVPLLDKTEARYAEIARLMVETDDWVTLYVDYGVPFWGKPPLSTWLSAISFQVFGINEFTARLPSFMLHLSLILLLCLWTRQKGKSTILLAFVLLTTPQFLLHTGVVSTDTLLGFCVTFVMLSFWKAITNGHSGAWKHIFFAALGLGLLAKGPIILILTIPPLLIWMWLHRLSILKVLKKLYALTGIFLTAIIAVPWYLLAESRTPGFIEYFIVGEHFKRFVDSGWKGDLYGVGHSQPHGMIWIFLLVFLFPWAHLVLIKLYRNRSEVFKNEWTSFLVVWLFWVPIFFTFSRNILHTYLLPCVVPMALLVTHWWGNLKARKAWLALGSFFPALVLTAFGTILLIPSLENYWNTDKYLLQSADEKLVDRNVPILFWKSKSYSGQFYSRTKARLISTESQLDSTLKKNDRVFLLAPKKYGGELKKRLPSGLRLFDSSLKTLIFLVDKDDGLTTIDTTRTGTIQRPYYE